MSATESRQFSNISSTTAVFSLIGGKYGLDISGTFSSGSVQVQTLSIDGSTWIPVGSSVSANGVQVLELPIGQYRTAVSGSVSAVYFSLTRIAKTRGRQMQGGRVRWFNSGMGYGFIRGYGGDDISCISPQSSVRV